MRRAAATTLLVIALTSPLRGDDLAGSGILEPARAFTIDSARLRFTYFDQAGKGFQSLAGAGPAGPGSEALWVAEPQLEIVAHQGENITHRIWVPVDIISAASPDAVDAVSTASKYNEAGSLDIASTFRVDRKDEVGTRFQFHIEENFRSYSMGLGWTRHMAEDNAVFQATVNQTFDWFDAYELGGTNRQRVARSTTNGNLSFSQILSPYTVGDVNYGITVQNGELSNTWNTVPLVDGTHGTENLPSTRIRHAVVGKVVQWLPWQASLRVSYRFYIDSWGAIGNTLELYLYQRITRYLYVRGTYRAHFQKGVDFYTDLAPLGEGYRTADADLASFTAQTVGGKVALDFPLRKLRNLGIDFAYERYWHSNDLRVNTYSTSVGVTF